MDHKKTSSLTVLLLSALILGSCMSQSTLSPTSTRVEETHQPSPTAHPPETDTTLVPNPDKKDHHSYYIHARDYRIYSTDRTASKKIVLLTFDDGPKGKVTRQILDILDKYDAKSIWFVSGFNYGPNYKPHPQKAETFKQLIKEIHDRGHIIANHTWEHENMRNIPPDKQRKEIVALNELLQSITGEKPKYFRPPFGAYTDVQNQVMVEENMQWMNWSVGSLDWEYEDPQQVVRQVVSTVHDGANILLHDLPVTAQALDPLLKQLTEMGYKFVLPTEVRLE